MKIRSNILLPACLAGMLILAGCATEPASTTEFRFPVLKGNIEHGKQSFVALGCHQCHSVNGVTLPAYPGGKPIDFELGGRIGYVKTYAALLTSIINPDHVISGEYLEKLHGQRKGITSPMPYRGEMTVTQLVDIVTFLNSRYMLMKDYSLY